MSFSGGGAILAVDALEVAPEVNRLLSRLIGIAGLVSLAEEQNRRCRDVETQLAELAEKRRELEARKDEIQKRLGIHVEIAEEWLPLLIDNVGEWQTHHTLAASLRSAVDGLQGEREGLLQKASQLLASFGLGPVDSSERLALAVEDLESRLVRFQDASRELDEARNRIERTLDPGLMEALAQKQRVLDRLGLDDGDRHVLQDWLRLRPRYLEVREGMAQSLAIVQDRRRALAGPHRARR